MREHVELGGLGHCALQRSVRNRHRQKNTAAITLAHRHHSVIRCGHRVLKVLFAGVHRSKPTAGNFWSIAANFPCPGGLGCLLVLTLQSSSCNGARDVGVGVAIFDAPVRAPHSCMFDAPSTHRQQRVLATERCSLHFLLALLPADRRVLCHNVLATAEEDQFSVW